MIVSNDTHQAIEKAVATMPPQPARMTQYLHLFGPQMTGAIASECSIGNVSDAAIRANQALELHGLKIVCHLPKPLRKNRFGEQSMQHLWRLVRLR